MVRATSIRPEGAPRLTDSYRDWREFVELVCRPWIDNDLDDEQAENWYRTLFKTASDEYLAAALVMADNRIRELERVRTERCDD